MRETIAVVDDEEDIVELISYNLKREGFDVRGFYDGESFISSLKSFYPDLVILDLLLPGMDGFEVCRYIRRDERLSRIPIIILSVKDSEIDKVVGLELGADDYLTKPFSTRELIARVKAVLRRYGVAGVNKASLIKRGSLLVDLETMDIEYGTPEVEVEFDIDSIDDLDITMDMVINDIAVDAEDISGMSIDTPNVTNEDEQSEYSLLMEEHWAEYDARYNPIANRSGMDAVNNNLFNKYLGQMRFDKNEYKEIEESYSRSVWFTLEDDIQSER